MSKIDYIIPVSNVEVIRDKIASILLDELYNQYQLSGDELFNIKVWLERFVPFDKTEIPTINVYYTNSSVIEKTPNTSKLKSSYNIDIYYNSKASQLVRGDVNSSLMLHKLLMVCRFILQNTNYLSLNINDLFIYTTYIDNIAITQPSEKDGTFTIGATINYVVEHEEYNGELSGILGNIFNAQIKLNDTDKGYYLTIN